MKHGSALVTTFMIMTLLMIPHAGAVSLNLELDTTEYINDLVFYSDGSYDCGNITGCLSITNPSSNHTVSDINIVFSDRIAPTQKHIDELEPNGTTIILYQLPGSGAIALPSVTETTKPSTLKINEEQEITYRIEIANPGSEEIDIISFEKSFPSQLEYTGHTVSEGSMSWTGNKSMWENFTISPHSSESLDLIFRTKPESDITLQPSSLSFTSPAIVASRSLSLSAVTTTRFTVEKQMVAKDKWRVGVIVKDASDFDYSLYRVEVYVSDTMLTEPTLIKEYDLDISLQPGDTWSDSFTYDYSGIPVFFARVYYTIPYTISGTTMPLKPAGTGGFVINSVVYGEQETTTTKDENHRIIVTSRFQPSNETEQNIPEETEIQKGVSDKNPEDVSLPDSEKEEHYNIFAILPLILMGLILIAGKKFLPLLINPKKQLVVGSNHLIEIIGTDGLKPLISNVNNVVMSRDTFKRLDSTGLIENIDQMLEDGNIKVIDTDPEMVKNIMSKYNLISEDAEILAAASTSEVKEVFITSTAIEEAVNDLGLKPVHLSDLKMDHNK